MMPMLLALMAAADFESLAKLFEYDRSRSAQEQSVLKEERAGARIFDYSFDSPVSGRVPGLLVVPARSGKHPVILYGHWMMDGSPMRNRNEFLEEAVVMARAGARCLLLDSPLVRPGVVQSQDPMGGDGAIAALQMAKEWRRALDLLSARRDADPKRVAYVGHSFNAGVGAKLTGVEKRIQSFVLMANQYSLREYVYDEENQEMAAMRKKAGDVAIEQYLTKFPWDDSVSFAGHSSPSAVFLQFGRNDKPISERQARLGYGHFGEPKKIAFYDAGHDLNQAALLERTAWLAARLKLKRIDEAALRHIPQLR